MMACIHAASGCLMYAFDVSAIGRVSVCWDCRRALYLRTRNLGLRGLLSIDAGRFGYKCARCTGHYTSTDAGTCTCPGRKQDCAAERSAQSAWSDYAEHVLWKPRAPARPEATA